MRLISTTTCILLICSCSTYNLKKWPVNINIVAGKPCFIIPSDNKIHDKHPTTEGYTIYKVIDGKYEMIWSTPREHIDSYFMLYPDKCLDVGYHDWQEGQYTIDGAVWFVNDSERRIYSAEFFLKRSPQSHQLELSDERIVK